MTDKAPERIWAWVDDVAGVVGSTEKPETPTDIPPGPNAVTAYAEYIRADLAHAVKQEWQPIETAPNDESIEFILGVLRPDGHFDKFAPCVWQEPGVISEEGFWVWWQAEPDFFVEVKNPTHWMQFHNLPEESE